MRRGEWKVESGKRKAGGGRRVRAFHFPLSAFREIVIVGLLAAALLGAINIPARSMIADPRIGTSEELKHTPDAAPAQVEKQMSGPRVAAPVRTTEPERSVAPTELPSGPEPRAVTAALEGEKTKTGDRRAPAPGGRSSTMLGLAITAGILGLICAGGMLAVRLGPKPPEPVGDAEEDG